MTSLNDLHRHVFDLLLEHHYREKEAGREFYFLTEISRSEPLSYSINPENQYEEVIVVRLLGRDSFNTRLSLLIKSKEDLYVFGNNSQSSSFDEYINSVKSILSQNFHRPINPVIRPGYAFKINNDLQGFLTRDWPPIKALFQAEKTDLDFITQQEFENYLAKSPFYSPPTNFVKKKLALTSLSVRNFRGIKHTSITNLPNNARWIFLTGENGFGKTSVLQAMAAGLHGRYDAMGTQLIPSSATIEVTYYIDETLTLTNRSSHSRTYAEQLRVTDHLATYGSSRLQISAYTTKESLEKQSAPTYSLFNTNAVLLDIEQLLKDTNAYRPDEFRQIVNIFKSLLPNLEKIEIDSTTKAIQVKYFEKDDEGKLVNDGVTFTQLAAGYRNVIAMIGDMIYRLSTKQEVTNLSDLVGIVIIDELELHLHPKFQKLFVHKLTELFPSIQFIASTHSPIPLLGAPHDTVLLHVKRSEQQGIEIEKLDIDFSILTPNAILTSPIFGFQELIPESKPNNEMIRSEQTYQEVLFNDQLEKQIDQYLTEENKQELLSLLKK